MKSCELVKAIVFDWAGTTIDHGSRAPASVFQEIFRRRGVDISTAQAREPMGRAKREHIAAIAAMPEVDAAWRKQHAAACDEAAIDSMYEEFLPLQNETLLRHCDMIDGVVEAVRECREMGLKIGSSTGYTHELMEVVSKAAKEQGYQPDCVLCSEDAPRGRPAPFLLYEAAKRMNVFPMWHFIKVDDTPVGIEAGRNAGCWTVGITRTGNGVGLSQEEFYKLSEAEQEARCSNAAQKLSSAGAHFILESAADIVPLILDIDQRLVAGELP